MIKIKHLFTTVLALAFSSIIFAQGPRFAPSKLVIRFDDAPQEITWEIRNLNGTVFQTGGGFDNQFANQTVSFEFTTAFGTSPLEFIIRDSAGNGLGANGAWAINSEVLGTVNLRNPDNAVGERIFNGDRNFGSETSVTFDPTTRVDDLGQLGEIAPSDISVFQVRDEFYRIEGNRFVRVTLDQDPGDDQDPNDDQEDPNDDQDQDDDQEPQAIESVLDVVVVNRVSRQLQVVINSDINDQVTIRLQNRRGVVRNITTGINQGRNSIILSDLRRSGRHLITIETSGTTGNITRRVFVRR